MAVEFGDDPGAWFGDNAHAAHHLASREVAAYQLEALARRFDALVAKIAPLGALAEAAGVARIEAIEDAVPLLFPHGFYKSYPETWLAEHRFEELTEWLQHFTTCDLSPVAARNFPTIDAWLAALDRETALHIFHSSGTTGRLSFYPRGKLENTRQTRHSRMSLADMVEPMGFARSALRFTMIWPSYATGHSAVLRAADLFRNSFTKTPDDFYPLFDARMSSDWQYFVMRAENARLSGGAALSPDDYTAQKIAESSALHSNEPKFVQGLLDRIGGALASEEIMLAGGPLALHRIAELGLAKGMKSAFAPGSIVSSFGGLKGQGAPDKMVRTIEQFSGVSRLLHNYGMTELSTGFSMCAAGRYHCPPWVIPYLFDAKNGRPLAREGKQSGRVGFVDLAAQSYWGGFISGDSVDLDYNPCSCGRTTPHIGPQIERLPSSDAADMMIGAASAQAIEAALEVLRG